MCAVLSNPGDLNKVDKKIQFWGRVLLGVSLVQSIVGVILLMLLPLSIIQSMTQATHPLLSLLAVLAQFVSLLALVCLGLFGIFVGYKNNLKMLKIYLILSTLWGIISWMLQIAAGAMTEQYQADQMRMQLAKYGVHFVKGVESSPMFFLIYVGIFALWNGFTIVLCCGPIYLVALRHMAVMFSKVPRGSGYSELGV